MLKERIFGFYDYSFYKGNNKQKVDCNFDYVKLNNQNMTVEDKVYILELTYSKSDNKYFGIISKAKDSSECTYFKDYDSNNKKNLKSALGSGALSYDDTGKSYFVFEVKENSFILLCEINNVAGARKICDFFNKYISKYKVRYSPLPTKKNKQFINKLLSADVLNVEFFTKDLKTMLLPTDDSCGAVSSTEIAEIKGYDLSFRIHTRKDNKKKTTLTEILAILKNKFGTVSGEEIFDLNTFDFYQQLNDYFKKAKVTLYTNGREENFNLLTDSDVYRLTIDINKKEEEDMAIKKKLFEALNDRK